MLKIILLLTISTFFGNAEAFAFDDVEYANANCKAYGNGLKIYQNEHTANQNAFDCFIFSRLGLANAVQVPTNSYVDKYTLFYRSPEGVETICTVFNNSTGKEDWMLVDKDLLSFLEVRGVSENSPQIQIELAVLEFIKEIKLIKIEEEFPVHCNELGS